MIVDSFYTQQEISFSHAALFVCIWVAYLFDKWLLCKRTQQKETLLCTGLKNSTKKPFLTLFLTALRIFFALSKKFATQMLSPIEILP